MSGTDDATGLFRDVKIEIVEVPSLSLLDLCVGLRTGTETEGRTIPESIL